jgi:hypothetical protein
MNTDTAITVANDRSVLIVLSCLEKWLGESGTVDVSPQEKPDNVRQKEYPPSGGRRGRLKAVLRTRRQPNFA